MKRAVLILATAVLFSSNSWAQYQENSSHLGGTQGWMMNGMNVEPLGDKPYGSRAACEEVRKLKRTMNVDTIVIRKNLVLSDFNSDQVQDPKSWGASDKQILRQFRVDKKLGVKSFFEMGVRLQNDLDSKASPDDCAQAWHAWHGSIDYAAPANYDKFFYDYSQKLLHYADLARQGGGVSVFSIGHEMASLSATKKLEGYQEKQNFVNNLSWFLSPSHMGKQANSWAKTVITDLMSFSDALKQREDAKIPVVIEADHRTPLQRNLNDMKWYLHDRKEELKSSLFHQSAPDYRKELANWAGSGAKSTLSQGATDYLIQLENTRRAYLEGMWEQLISQVRGKFSGMKHPPLITYNDSVSNQIGFLDKLDVISSSQYATIGSQDLDQHSKNYGMGIDDGKTSVQDLKQGWMRALNKVGDVATRLNKKVIFSELGFSRREHSTIDPWLWSGCQNLEKPDGTIEAPIKALDRPISTTERNNAIEALRELIQEGKVPWLSGVAMWNAYTNGKGVLDEYCVDCRVKEAAPYDANIRQLFKTVSAVTNKSSPVDPCIPPKPKPKPLVVKKEVKPAETMAEPQVPFLDFSDPKSNPLSMPFFDYRPSEQDFSATESMTW